MVVLSGIDPTLTFMAMSYPIPVSVIRRIFWHSKERKQF